MAQTAPAPAPKTFVIQMNVVKGTIDAHGAFENQMVVGDLVRFVSSQAGHMVIQFTPRAAIDAKTGNNVAPGLLPFDLSEIDDPSPSQLFPVKNSCKSMMSVTITAPDGTAFHCPWDAAGSSQGTNICTGGGSSPVKCP